MRLVAVVRPPPRPEEAAAAMARALEVAPAEARLRLAPEPPALLARLDADRAAALVRALRAAGAAAVCVDEPVPADRDRVVVRSFTFGGDGATFTPAAGIPGELRWADVVAILRGQRASRLEVERSERSKGFSAATAVATGGLALTRTSTKTTRSAEESTEQVVLVYPRQGRAVLFAERRVDLSCLGEGMQASSTANMVEIARRLREGARAAWYDERLVRLGRRPLPFLVSGESRVASRSVATTRLDTSGALDVLAEVLRQAVSEGLLP